MSYDVRECCFLMYRWCCDGDHNVNNWTFHRQVEFFAFCITDLANMKKSSV